MVLFLSLSLFLVAAVGLLLAVGDVIGAAGTNVAAVVAATVTR